ncbi:MAG TPA: response regulator transcription factor [Flavipsychrobacter sp.]|nr:response regulator transcription factor [Flavipsychrobacter sp.]
MEQTRKALNILVVEDDINLGYLIVENLKTKGFEVSLAKNGREGLRCIMEKQYDLCIFDVMLPEIDGFYLAERLRKVSNTPFIFLTARTQEKDKVKGFETGADDYITKPFSFKELYYRILVALRRADTVPKNIEEDAISIGTITLYPAVRILSINGQQRKLSQREAGLMYMLLQHNGSYVNRSEILKKVWGNDDYFTAKSMDVYITRIRKLLKDDPTIEVENLYGTGYRIRQITLNNY